MKMRGVALRTPWRIEENNIRVKQAHTNRNQHWLSWYNLHSAPKQLPDSPMPKISMCKLQLWAPLCPHVQPLKDPCSKGHWIPPTKINKNMKMNWSYCTHIWICAFSASRKNFSLWPSANKKRSLHILVLVCFVTKPQKLKVSKYHFHSHMYKIKFLGWCMRRQRLPLV